MALTIKYMSGDVLQLISIIGQSTGVLEKRVGFHSCRLAEGFDLWLFDDKVYLDEFEWGGTTDFPGNWFPSGEDYTGADSVMNWAHAEDIKRWQLFKNAGFDADRGDYSFDLWKGQQARLLNDAAPSARIVKIVPRIPHDKAMPSWKQYPKAQGSSIRQWKLRTRNASSSARSLPAGVAVSAVAVVTRLSRPDSQHAHDPRGCAGIHDASPQPARTSPHSQQRPCRTGALPGAPPQPSDQQNLFPITPLELLPNLAQRGAPAQHGFPARLILEPVSHDARIVPPPEPALQSLDWY